MSRHADRRCHVLGKYNEIYCEAHDQWFREPDAFSHECFNSDWSASTGAKILPPHENIDYKFQVRRDGILDFMDADRLLAEWYNWWAKSEHAPAKMPDSIHTRTAIYLATKNMEYKKKNDSQG